MSNTVSMHQLKPEHWIEDYADGLFYFALVRVGDRETAKDLIQDTFVAALRAASGFTGNASEKTWLYAILKNKITDHYRKKEASCEPCQEVEEGGEEFLHPYFEGPEGDDGHWRQKASPSNWNHVMETPVETEEFYRFLEKCLGNLPQKWSAAFRLKNIEDMEAEDICKELGISSSNYWVVLHRARLQLRSCMEKTWMGIHVKQ